jgi:hypothetical protein
MPAVNNNKTKTVSGDLLWTQDVYGVDGDNRQLAGQIRCYASADATAGAVPGRWEFWTANSAGVLIESQSIDAGMANKLGYAAGDGGTVTQATSKSTAVTLDKPAGQITMHNAALASFTAVSFTLTSSVIAAGDIILINHISAGTAGAYSFNAQSAAGQALITVRNLTTNNEGAALVLGYAVIKAPTA